MRGSSTAAVSVSSGVWVVVALLSAGRNAGFLKKVRVRIRRDMESNKG